MVRWLHTNMMACVLMSLNSQNTLSPLSKCEGQPISFTQLKKADNSNNANK